MAIPYRAQRMTEQNEASDKQWSYVRSLLDEAFVNHYEHGLGLDRHHRPPHYSKSQASSDIAALLSAKQRGWKQTNTLSR
jgi:hypothetical protein